MFQFQIIIRTILLYFVITLPFIGPFLVFLGTKGIWISFALSAALLILVGGLSEKILIHLIYRAKLSTDMGLSHTLKMAQRASGTKSQRLPQIYVFSDPFPEAVHLKSLGSGGAIILSQGFLSILNEQELRFILGSCLKRNDQPGQILRGICSIFCALVIAPAPKSWVKLVFSGVSLTQLEEFDLSPFSAIGFLILFPMIRLFSRLGDLSFIFKTENMNTSHISAIQKLEQAYRILGDYQPRNPLSFLAIPLGRE